MVHEIPDESALQPISTTKIKHSIGKSACAPKHKPFSSKHLRDDSSSTIVPSVAESQAGGSDGASPLENGNSKTGRMKRSHSHSGAKLFEQLFHKRCESNQVARRKVTDRKLPTSSSSIWAPQYHIRAESRSPPEHPQRSSHPYGSLAFRHLGIGTFRIPDTESAVNFGRYGDPYS